MVDVSKTIFSEKWQLFERKERVYLQGDDGTNIVLSTKDAHKLWQVLNKWVERNAPNVEVEK